MLWWYWMLLGLGLLMLEMLTPGGLFALFFGLAALVVGVLVGMGVNGPSWLQWLLFAILSVVSLLLCRGPLLTRVGARGNVPLQEPIDTLVGASVTLLEDLQPGTIGRGELRGTVWTVQSEDTGSLHRGQRCRVQRVEGLTLWVMAAERKGEDALRRHSRARGDTT